jgi:hypothetical protein
MLPYPAAGTPDPFATVVEIELAVPPALSTKMVKTK